MSALGRDGPPRNAEGRSNPTLAIAKPAGLPMIQPFPRKPFRQKSLAGIISDFCLTLSEYLPNKLTACGGERCRARKGINRGQASMAMNAFFPLTTAGGRGKMGPGPSIRVRRALVSLRGEASGSITKSGLKIQSSVFGGIVAVTICPNELRTALAGVKTELWNFARAGEGSSKVPRSLGRWLSGFRRSSSHDRRGVNRVRGDPARLKESSAGPLAGTRSFAFRRR
jgi:hypothetical protein